jgi:hypothetical protein
MPAVAAVTGIGRMRYHENLNDDRIFLIVARAGRRVNEGSTRRDWMELALRGLLLGHAVEGAQAQDKVEAMDADYLAGGE